MTDTCLASSAVEKLVCRGRWADLNSPSAIETASMRGSARYFDQHPAVGICTGLASNGAQIETSYRAVIGILFRAGSGLADRRVLSSRVQSTRLAPATHEAR